MPLHPRKTAPRPGILSYVALLATSLVGAPAFADLQTGRDARDTLWISDQPLPAGVRPAPPTPIEIGTLPPTSPASSTQHRPSEEYHSVPVERIGGKQKDKATCDGIEQRYEGARLNLDKATADKAAGKMLIPESGLISMRQNLATLDRLRSLCQ